MLMLRIETLQVPPTLPSGQVIRSWGQNQYNYDPEVWEFQYEIYRYLENLAEDALVKRYKSIVRNLARLVSRERDIIPINSFLSSWYWYRKEHQTRLEFHLRSLSPPISPPREMPSNDHTNAPARSRSPNAGDVLFRFGESQHMVPFVQRGAIRIGAASKYLAGTPGDPRTDDELQKHSFLPGRHTRITTQSGHQIPVIGDVRLTVSDANYYVLCMSSGYHPDLFSDFKADACVVIQDLHQFADRIENAARAHLPGWNFHHNPVQYFDPLEMGRNEVFDTIMSKDFSFAYQMEYRFIWFSLEGIAASGYKCLHLGPLDDIAFVYNLSYS